MTDRTEGGLAIAASLIVLFTALLEPMVSAGIAVALLVGYGAWKLLGARRG